MSTKRSALEEVKEEPHSEEPGSAVSSNDDTAASDDAASEAETAEYVSGPGSEPASDAEEEEEKDEEPPVDYGVEPNEGFKYDPRPVDDEFLENIEVPGAPNGMNVRPRVFKVDVMPDGDERTKILKKMNKDVKADNSLYKKNKRLFCLPCPEMKLSGTPVAQRVRHKVRWMLYDDATAENAARMMYANNGELFLVSGLNAQANAMPEFYNCNQLYNSTLLGARFISIRNSTNVAFNAALQFPDVDFSEKNHTANKLNWVTKAVPKAVAPVVDVRLGDSIAHWHRSFCRPGRPCSMQAQPVCDVALATAQAAGVIYEDFPPTSNWHNADDGADANTLSYLLPKDEAVHLHDAECHRWQNIGSGITLESLLSDIHSRQKALNKAQRRKYLDDDEGYTRANTDDQGHVFVGKNRGYWDEYYTIPLVADCRPRNLSEYVVLAHSQDLVNASNNIHFYLINPETNEKETFPLKLRVFARAGGVDENERFAVQVHAQAFRSVVKFYAQKFAPDARCVNSSMVRVRLTPELSGPLATAAMSRVAVREAKENTTHTHYVTATVETFELTWPGQRNIRDTLGGLNMVVHLRSWFCSQLELAARAHDLASGPMPTADEQDLICALKYKKMQGLLQNNAEAARQIKSVEKYMQAASRASELQQLYA